MGKAGGFGIQGLGGLLIEKVEGEFNNVSLWIDGGGFLFGLLCKEGLG